mmetsp:Transcript_44480/g.96773  ORF Transcript_44480/g.96773 Transcript_44480/m.96773 type:complete len:407 (+) Transcript_44480:54-1274(+)
MGNPFSTAAQPTFRSKANVTWQVSNSDWSNFVEHTFTKEAVQGWPVESSATLDDDGLRSELMETSAGDFAVAARVVYAADCFVSWGRLLAPQSSWESLEGIWISSDSSNTRKRGSHRIERLEDGTLECREIITPQTLPSDSARSFIFGGRAFRLDATDKTGASAWSEASVHEASLSRLVWRWSSDGIGEVNMSQTGVEEWKPCRVCFSEDLSSVTIMQGRGMWGQSRNIIFHREGPSDGSQWVFQGVDLVFGDCGPELKDAASALYVTLHLVRLDLKRKVLHIVYSHSDAYQSFQLGSLNVPVPQASLAALGEQTRKWARHVRPLSYHGARYSEDQMMEAMSTWMMFDFMLTSTCYSDMLPGISDCSGSPHATDGCEGDLGDGEGGGLFDSLFQALFGNSLSLSDA